LSISINSWNEKIENLSSFILSMSRDYKNLME